MSDVSNGKAPVDETDETLPDGPNKPEFADGNRNVLDFPVTDGELSVLIEHYVQAILINRWDARMLGVYSSGRSEFHARVRVHEIVALIGDEMAKRAIDTATDNFRRSVGPEAWRIFEQGSEEERLAYAERFHETANEVGKELRGE